MAHYIALIHKEPDTDFGVAFPDLPGLIAAGDTLDDAIRNAGELLVFAAEDWTDLTGGDPFPTARTIDEIRADPTLTDQLAGATLVAIPLIGAKFG
jgi:predicted RNase H-like HicB family nuclease